MIIHTTKHGSLLICMSKFRNIQKGGNMAHDFNKPPHVTNEEEVTRKKRIPVFILILVGIFLASLIFYMIADREPQPGVIPADTSIPATQENSSNTMPATNDQQQDSNTATATDH